MKQILEQRTVQVPKDDSVFVTDRQGHDGMYRGSENVTLATLSNDQKAKLADWLLTVVGINGGSKWAFIGAGFCYMPRLIGFTNWPAVDIYEIEQSIIDYVVGRFPTESAAWDFVVGDYKTTLSGNYDVIVYDIEEPPDMVLLNAHLKSGGVILKDEAV